VIDLGPDAPNPTAILDAVLSMERNSSFHNHARRLRPASMTYQSFDEIATGIGEVRQP
jgi:hypothetical protein